MDAFRATIGLYGRHFPELLVASLQQAGYRALPFLRAFWHAQDFDYPTPHRHSFAPTSTALLVRNCIRLLIVIQLGSSMVLVMLGKFHGLVAGELFGLALLAAYPVLTVHIVALALGLRKLLLLLRHPKKFGRSIVCRILEHQVRQLITRNQLTIVAVVGSIGKTSTKLAIAKVLESQFRVRYQVGNYNDRVTVPLIFFGKREPSILNIFAWLRIFISNAKSLRHEYPYDVVVVELGTDHPGCMSEFDYLPINLAVVTAVTAEHMEFFADMDAVAMEELAVCNFADTVLINGDNVAATYLAGRRFKEYSLLSTEAHYFAKISDSTLQGQHLALRLASGRKIQTTTSYIGEPGARVALAAAAVGEQLDMEASEIAKAIKKLEPFAGRMTVLAGKEGSVIIDDTYNASPVAVIAALDVLYASKSKQRIAILGSMNELGDYSKAAHQEVANYCDPKKLDLVVTIGKDAKKYLAPAARTRGCTVRSFGDPYEAGRYVLADLKPGAIILAEGSQNGVFAEEAVKLLLANPTDVAKLVRQSKYWLKKKQQQFAEATKGV